jgi:hypothetical protein
MEVLATDIHANVPQCDATVYDSERAEMVGWCSASLQTNDNFNIPLRRLLKLMRVSLIPNAIREVEQILRPDEHFTRRKPSARSNKHRAAAPVDSIYLNLKGALMYTYWLNARYRYKRAEQIYSYLHEVYVYESRTIGIIADAVKLGRLDGLDIPVPAITHILVTAMKSGQMPGGRELLNLYREATDPQFVRPTAVEAVVANGGAASKFVVVDPNDPNDMGSDV